MRKESNWQIRCKACHGLTGLIFGLSSEINPSDFWYLRGRDDPSLSMGLSMLKSMLLLRSKPKVAKIQSSVESKEGNIHIQSS